MFSTNWRIACPVQLLNLIRQDIAAFSREIHLDFHYVFVSNVLTLYTFVLFGAHSIAHWADAGISSNVILCEYCLNAYRIKFIHVYASARVSISLPLCVFA